MSDLTTNQAALLRLAATTPDRPRRVTDGRHRATVRSLVERGYLYWVPGEYEFAPTEAGKRWVAANPRKVRR